MIKLRSEQDNLRVKALKKVDLIAPETIFLSKDTTFGKNVKIEPYVVIGSKVKIEIMLQSNLFSFRASWKKCYGGPICKNKTRSHFLPGSKVGNFVETKNSKIKSKSKINHLSYIGDTEVGENSNIELGTTCNYDGVKK